MNAARLSTLLFPALLALPACKGDKEAGAPDKAASSARYEYDCRVWIATAGSSDKPVTGAATDPDEAAATEAAWTAACGKLPADQQARCRDESAFKSSKTVSKSDTGPVTVAIALRPADPAQIDARAVSSESEEAACKQAMLDACKQAGAEGDCVAAGTHVKKGEASGKVLTR